MNRKQAPLIQPIEQIELLDAEKTKLQNGIRIYQLHGGSQEVLSLQLIIPAGRWQEQKALQALLTSELVLEGTLNKSSEEIANIIDFYGAHIDASVSYDLCTIQLVCLTKHLPPLLEVLIEILEQPAFSESELLIKKNKLIQKLHINQQKSDYLAQRYFHEKLFGKTHPYGYRSSEKAYQNLSSEDLLSFFKEKYSLTDGFLLLAGNYSPTDLKLICDSFEQIKSKQKSKEIYHKTDVHFGQFSFQKENAQQASIRIGSPNVIITHPDFQGLQLLNTVLGGYFGSRLMSNLREEKGYTYGVYSSMASFIHEGYFLISTDVGIDQASAAVEEIYHEMRRLKKEPVKNDELQTVKNYLMGKYLSQTDGPFSQAKVFRSIISRNQTAQDYVNRVQSTQDITAERIQELANQYFDFDKMIEVVVK